MRTSLSLTGQLSPVQKNEMAVLDPEKTSRHQFPWVVFFLTHLALWKHLFIEHKGGGMRDNAQP